MTGKNMETALARQLIAGIEKHFSNLSSLRFGNGTFTPAQVEASFQTLIDMRTAVDDAKTAALPKIAEEDAQSAPVRRQMSAFVAYV
jgi:hypothetical protein